MSDEIVREYNVAFFRGDLPNVPLAPGVDLDAIKEMDTDPFFTILPIIPEIGAVSNNGLLYDDALAESIAEQINTKRTGGIFGHLKDEDRATAYPIPEGIWVGAKREQQTLWGKAYVPPGAARDHIKRLRAVRGSIATSIYGKGKHIKVREGVRRLENFVLESLDFAPPERAALGYGAIPHVTAEMEDNQEVTVDKAQIIAELTVNDIAALPQSVRDAIVAEASKKDETAQTITELTNTVTAKDAVIAELQSTVEEMRRERVNSAIDAKVAELTDWQVNDEEGKAKLKSLRDMLTKQIVMRLGSDFKAERVAELATAAWEDIKPIAELVRDALAGPAAIVGSKPHGMGGALPKLEDTPENRAQAAASMGIAV